MKIIESEVMQSSSTVENENDISCFHDNAIIDHKLNQEVQLDEPTNVDGFVKKKVLEFYFIKYWPYEDQSLKSRLQEAEKVYKRVNLEAWSLADKFTERLLDQRNAFAELTSLRSRNTANSLERTLKKLDQLREALDKLNSAKNARQRRDIKSCSSRELINSMLHGTKNLATEKKLLREINKRQQKGAVHSFSPEEELRLLTVENATEEGHICNLIVTKKAIQAEIRYMSKISGELRKGHLEVKGKTKWLEKDLEIAEKDISNFRKEFNDVKQRREEANRRILNLKRQQDEENGRYCRYATILSNARELARKRNVKALQKLSIRQVDIFMYQWNKTKALRYNYERSILLSLESRELSRDGRTRNLNEQLLPF